MTVVLLRVLVGSLLWQRPLPKRAAQPHFAKSGCTPWLIQEVHLLQYFQVFSGTRTYFRKVYKCETIPPPQHGISTLMAPRIEWFKVNANNANANANTRHTIPAAHVYRYVLRTRVRRVRLEYTPWVLQCAIYNIHAVACCPFRVWLCAIAISIPGPMVIGISRLCASFVPC